MPVPDVAYRGNQFFNFLICLRLLLSINESTRLQEAQPSGQQFKHGGRFVLLGIDKAQQLSEKTVERCTIGTQQMVRLAAFGFWATLLGMP